jgi:hypothetical protein
MAGGLMTAAAGEEARVELDALIDKIEAAYEFCLAYAAQGRRSDRGAQGDSGLRKHLTQVEQALDEIAPTARRCADSVSADLTVAARAFFDALERDAAAAQGAVRLVSSRQDISSQLIDNLNASIHLRAVLTDVFVIDEALK